MKFVEALELASYFDHENKGMCKIISLTPPDPLVKDSVFEIFYVNENDNDHICPISDLKGCILYSLEPMEYDEID